MDFLHWLAIANGVCFLTNMILGIITGNIPCAIASGCVCLWVFVWWISQMKEGGKNDSN
ncbi:hypothetical protein LCGC14_2883640 [marine sediment metagenome]|uniref:Uncharacterized protein n=1 Tax=marine sediment metagenome TaxID=412755 RepID=A0A0F8YL63_9ZZZZ